MTAAASLAPRAFSKQPQVDLDLGPLSKLSSEQKKKTKVMVALSGGVDSAVSAHLLLKEGFDVSAIHMSNWSEEEERGYCTGKEDRIEAERVAAFLDIRCHFVEFEKEYWNFVFSPALADWEDGVRTPNPDILCNVEIKFKRLLEKALSMGADYLATGHYVRSRVGADGKTELLKGLDPNKDQSYFLCQVNHAALSRVVFPVGAIKKPQVRDLASSAGLPNADRKDSVGICFIGKRKFDDFLGEYVPARAGNFVDLEGNVVGKHKGLPFYTIGQGASISGQIDKLFVAGKSKERNEIITCPHGHHPALYSYSLSTKNFNWIAGQPPEDLSQGSFEGRTRYRQNSHPCRVFLPASSQPTQLEVTFSKPVRAVATGQTVCLYRGDVCLGGGTIDLVSPSLFQLGETVPNSSDVHEL